MKKITLYIFKCKLIFVCSLTCYLKTFITHLDLQCICQKTWDQGLKLTNLHRQKRSIIKAVHLEGEKNWIYSRATSLPTPSLLTLRNLNWPRYKDTRSDGTPTWEELKILWARAQRSADAAWNIAGTLATVVLTHYVLWDPILRRFAQQSAS